MPCASSFRFADGKWYEKTLIFRREGVFSRFRAPCRGSVAKKIRDDPVHRLTDARTDGIILCKDKLIFCPFRFYVSMKGAFAQQFRVHCSGLEIVEADRKASRITHGHKPRRGKTPPGCFCFCP